MEVDLANIVFSWLLHIDLACVVCNWDPATQSWVPYTAGGVGAGAGGLGLSNLFGPEVGGTAVGDTSAGGGTATNGGQDSGETPPGSGNGPPDPSAAVREHQQLLDNHYRASPRGSTTAPPSQPTTGAGGLIHRSLRSNIQDRDD